MSGDEVLSVLLEQRRRQTRWSLRHRTWVMLVVLLGLGVSVVGGYAALTLWRDGARPSALKLVVLAYGVLSFGGVLIAWALWLLRARTRVVPYFARELGRYPGESSVAFGRGHHLYRHSALLDRTAVSLGVQPLSAFGFGDDLYGQPVRWSPAAEGLRTVEALRGAVTADSDVARDLGALATALKVAADHGVEFALLLRLGAGDLQSAAVFEPRERIGRFW
jgi:hypothetical protein